MEIKKFIDNFASQFDETDPSAFALDTRFRELEEWSLLVALSVIAMADESYKVKLTGDDILELIAPFIPAPLIDKATGLGYTHWLDKRSGSEYRVYFRKE